MKKSVVDFCDPSLKLSTLNCRQGSLSQIQPTALLSVMKPETETRS